MEAQPTEQQVELKDLELRGRGRKKPVTQPLPASSGIDRNVEPRLPISARGRHRSRRERSRKRCAPDILSPQGNLTQSLNHNQGVFAGSVHGRPLGREVTRRLAGAWLFLGDCVGSPRGERMSGVHALSTSPVVSDACPWLEPAGLHISFHAGQCRQRLSDRFLAPSLRQF